MRLALLLPLFLFAACRDKEDVTDDTGADADADTDADTDSDSDSDSDTDSDTDTDTDTDNDTDSDTDADIEQGVDGTVRYSHGICGNPGSVDVYEAEPTASACDWSPEFDTGFSDTGDWTDNVGALAAAPAVDAADRFGAELAVGDYEVRHFGDCYGCVAFAVDEGEVAEVELTLQETMYADAPNIYLYPERTTGLSVRLSEARHVVVSDPEYPAGGWQVLATPEGRLITAEGVADFLFYELRTPADRLQREAGWCVEGHLAQASIEDAMALAGFLDAEIVDFSDFWDAHWPSADWMTVYPQTRRLGVLRIDPAPDELLRLWFVVDDGCHPVEEPQLPRAAREGFHAAEWGVVFDRAYPRDWELVQ